MSNCVNVHTDTVIPKSQINYRELFRSIDEINEFPKAPTDLHGYIIWRFLGRNNVIEEEDNIVIRFGGHRSGHTWRDLDQTGHVLAAYTDDLIVCPMDVSDEGDGFKSVGRYNLVVKRFEK